MSWLNQSTLPKEIKWAKGGAYNKQKCRTTFTCITTPRPCAALLQWSIHLRSDLLNQFELSSSRDYFTTSYLIQKKNNLYQYNNSTSMRSSGTIEHSLVVVIYEASEVLNKLQLTSCREKFTVPYPILEDTIYTATIPNPLDNLTLH